MMHEPPGAGPPRISIVIASKVGAPFIGQCLDSVKEQAEKAGAEVIVVAAGAADYARRIAEEFPWTRVIHASDVRKVPALRGRGVEEARGEWIGVIEEHCSAKADWLEQALAAHATGHYAAAGGPVVDYDYPRLRDWVVYFLEYNGALPPVARGETADLNDANIVYRRSVLAEHMHLLGEGYWPMTLHPTLLDKGGKLLSVPEMIVYHRGPFDFGYYLHQRFLFSRAFAGVRAQSQSKMRRLAYIVGVPLVPVMLLARMTARVVRKRRRIAQFFMTLPLTIPALVVMVAGEWVGYVVGPGDALSKVE
jgi:glycosyltransferase involved in cell wall biosynthesis